jgi:hypothetical protein
VAYKCTPIELVAPVDGAVNAVEQGGIEQTYGRRRGQPGGNIRSHLVGAIDKILQGCVGWIPRQDTLGENGAGIEVLAEASPQSRGSAEFQCETGSRRETVLGRGMRYSNWKPWPNKKPNISPAS